MPYPRMWSLFALALAASPLPAVSVAAAAISSTDSGVPAGRSRCCASCASRPDSRVLLDTGDSEMVCAAAGSCVVARIGHSFAWMTPFVFERAPPSPPSPRRAVDPKRRRRVRPAPCACPRRLPAAYAGAKCRGGRGAATTPAGDELLHASSFPPIAHPASILRRNWCRSRPTHDEASAERPSEEIYYFRIAGPSGFREHRTTPPRRFRRTLPSPTATCSRPRG